MQLLEKYIEKLKQLLKMYEESELSLRDLDLLDELFNETIEEIKELKESIIYDRWKKLFDD